MNGATVSNEFLNLVSVSGAHVYRASASSSSPSSRFAGETKKAESERPAARSWSRGTERERERERERIARNICAPEVPPPWAEREREREAGVGAGAHGWAVDDRGSDRAATGTLHSAPRHLLLLPHLLITGAKKEGGRAPQQFGLPHPRSHRVLGWLLAGWLVWRVDHRRKQLVRTKAAYCGLPREKD